MFSPSLFKCSQTPSHQRMHTCPWSHLKRFYIISSTLGFSIFQRENMIQKQKNICTKDGFMYRGWWILNRGMKLVACEKEFVSYKIHLNIKSSLERTMLISCLQRLRDLGKGCPAAQTITSSIKKKLACHSFFDQVMKKKI